MTPAMQFILNEASLPADALAFDNTADVLAEAPALAGRSAVLLKFPKWTDGRAYSQAVLLRGRLKFGGEIVATGPGGKGANQAVAAARMGAAAALIASPPAVARACSPLEQLRRIERRVLRIPTACHRQRLEIDAPDVAGRSVERLPTALAVSGPNRRCPTQSPA